MSVCNTGDESALGIGVVEIASIGLSATGASVTSDGTTSQDVSPDVSPEASLPGAKRRALAWLFVGVDGKKPTRRIRLGRPIPACHPKPNPDRWPRPLSTIGPFREGGRWEQPCRYVFSILCG